MRRRRGKGWFYVLVVAAMLGMLSSQVWAEEETEYAENAENVATAVNFHGYLEANVVLRDGGGNGLGRKSGSGFQYGVLDHTSLVQQRNTLKFDVDIEPKTLRWGDFGVNKVHMTYRGAYDSVFDLRSREYGNIPEKGGAGRFDYGLRDIRFENDLREVFVDFTYKGALGNAFFRPGRQLVSWGETAGMNILDVINPKDNSFQMFFQNPDDLAIPTYMARLNYSIPRQPGFGLNLDLLWIPDIRPDQFAPTDKSMSAPYINILSTFTNLGVFNAVQQDVPTEKQEYGAKVMMDIGARLTVNLVYFHDVVNGPGLVMSPAPPNPAVTKVYLTHNEQNIYGGYFSYQFEPLDIIIRGEFARQTDVPITLPSASPAPYNDHGLAGLATFKYKPVTMWMLGFDKSKLVRWIAPHQNSSFTVQWIHKQINDWEDIFERTARSSSVAKDVDLLSFQVSTTWFEGTVTPSFVAFFNPGASGDGGGSGMTNVSVTWYLTKQLTAKAGFMAFWGDKDSKSSYAGLVGSSETTLKVAYEW